MLSSWFVYLCDPNGSFHLVRNPELVERLKSEIAEVVPQANEEITRKHIQQLPFLRCCLNESM